MRRALATWRWKSIWLIEFQEGREKPSLRKAIGKYKYRYMIRRTKPSGKTFCMLELGEERNDLSFIESFFSTPNSLNSVTSRPLKVRIRGQFENLTDVVSLSKVKQCLTTKAWSIQSRNLGLHLVATKLPRAKWGIRYETRILFTPSEGLEANAPIDLRHAFSYGSHKSQAYPPISSDYSFQFTGRQSSWCISIRLIRCTRQYASIRLIRCTRQYVSIRSTWPTSIQSPSSYPYVHPSSETSQLIKDIRFHAAHTVH